ncbi:unnamed protein product [Durusdinium trenchii]|uniref:Rab proteins geranylgeranyltransferase component n=1 Tax=Durusdinium trenchii TaxID=1381693 RepID=A0ABP0L563_9DINO
MALLTDDECQADVVVLGTGLTESIVAAAVARSGRRVLHLDAAETYGGAGRSLPLREYIAWAGDARDARMPGDGVQAGGDLRSLPRHGWQRLWEPFAPRRTPETAEMPEETREQTEVPEGQRAFALSPERTECYAERSFEWDPFQQMNGIRRKKNELLRNPSAFSLDLSPRLLYGRSEHVDVLIESGVARYLEFQGLKFTRVLTSEGLISVPLTKSEIFQDAHLSKAEKRMLMRFITSIQPYVSSLAFQSAAQLGVDQAAKIKGPSDQSALGMELDGSWRAFLQQQNLSERLQDFITYSICLWDWAPTEAFPQLSCREALERLGAFISSLGLYGRGTSMPLLFPMYGIGEVSQGYTRLCAVHRGVYALRTRATHLLAQEEEDGTMQLSGLVTCRGEQIKASRLVAACGELLQDQVPSQSSSQHCRRMTVLLSSPPLGEEGVSLCVVPPQSLDPPLQNVVQVLQLDFSSGACPHGYFLAHLSQASISDPGPLPFADLDRVLEELLKRSPKTACIFRCRYLQRPRDVATRWDVSTRTGGFMERCLHEERLAVVSDPPAVPQLLAVQEVHDARRIFGSFFGAESAFLPKPQHVAEEEMSGSLEELEHFNQQMQAQEAQEAQEPPVASLVQEDAEQ